jgi:hypothetical protein
VYSLTYVSSAVLPFTKDGLRWLLDECAPANEAVNVTGMLLYKDGNFIQVLEGEEHSVRSVYAKIGRDLRHRGLITLLQGEIAERQFPNWSMGFRELSHAPGSIEKGYSDFMNLSFTPAQFASNPTQAQALLLLFKAGLERNI